MQEKLYTITIDTENKPDALYRVTDMFMRRKLPMEHVSMEETKQGNAVITIETNAEETTIEKLKKQIERIIEVIAVTSFSHHNTETLKHTAKVINDIEASAIKRIELLAKTYDGVISLAQGIPSFGSAPHIRQAAKDAIDAGLADKYTSGYGIEPLRSAIVEKVKRDNNISVTNENIIVTHGGIEALMTIFLTLVNPREEIIIITPDYASHLTQLYIVNQGRKPVCVPLKETQTGWELDPENIEAHITPRTKAILVCNPCNPTGKVYTEKELKQIAQIAIKHNLYIITDEMYEYFTFDGRKHISIGSFPEVVDRTISIFGLSKSYAMTGWRIGYIVASKPLIHQLFKIHDSLITCPTAVSQYAAVAAVTGSQDMVKEYNVAFAKRRSIVVEALKDVSDVELVAPEGAYYAFVKIKKPVDDTELAHDMIKKAKVAVVPGSPFGTGGENHIRISFGCEEEQLREGMKRFGEYFRNSKHETRNSK